ncbi:ribbon-helix-helix protein, CopG family [Candidatus Pacearchaeota archaeon]|nr:ribbon-helix-helix protein, CopG family [Candidatus Pacearchaeota archaeon]
MKERISATLDPQTIQLVQALVKKFGYRNSSHLIEEAIKSFSHQRNKK